MVVDTVCFPISMQVMVNCALTYLERIYKTEDIL